MTDIAQLLGIRRREFSEPSTHRWNELLGVELELEDVVFPSSNPAGRFINWMAHSDASLRNGIEYVTATPMGGPVLEGAIEEFFRDGGPSFSKGPRTSTHIHINMTDSTVGLVQSLFMIMYMIEDAVYASVEEARKWGGYSMPMAEMSTTRIRQILAPRDDKTFISGVCPSRNPERYYGLNTNIRKHGTVEFRYFPGGPTRQELVSWIDLVVAAKAAARKHSVGSLIEALTTPESVTNFVQEEFGEWGSRFLRAVPADQMLLKFQEVASMTGDEKVPELGSNLIFVSPLYLSFIINKILAGEEEAKKYLTEALGSSKIFPKQDWNYYMENARAFSRQAAYKASLGGLDEERAHAAEAEDGPEDWDDEDAPEVSPPEVAISPSPERRVINDVRITPQGRTEVYQRFETTTERMRRLARDQVNQASPSIRAGNSYSGARLDPQVFYNELNSSSPEQPDNLNVRNGWFSPTIDEDLS